MESSAMSDKRPAPKDISHHFSRVTKNRAASSIKDFYKVKLTCRILVDLILTKL